MSTELDKMRRQIVDLYSKIDKMSQGGGEGGIPEAPEDGEQYGRQSNEWTLIDNTIGNVRPYKSFTANITQDGTDSPIVIDYILENQFNSEITTQRIVQGQHKITCTEWIVDNEKVRIYPEYVVNGAGNVGLTASTGFDSSTGSIQIFANQNGTPSDYFGFERIELRIYD